MDGFDCRGICEYLDQYRVLLRDKYFFLFLLTRLGVVERLRVLLLEEEP